MTKAPSVLTSTHKQTLVVTINRPAVRNAVDGPTAATLAKIFKDFDEDENLAVAILTGSRDQLCAGADLKATAAGDGNRVAPTGDGPMGPSRLSLSKPVIAAVEGYAVAGGLELACWCDLRIAAEDAVFGVFCRRWGVPLVDGGTVRLPRLIGASNALDMILTGRPVSAEEALRMGLANRVCASGAALATALELAAELAEFPQLCLRSDLRSAREQWGMNEAQALLNETQRGLGVIRSGETRRGAERFANGAGRHGAFTDHSVAPPDTPPA